MPAYKRSRKAFKRGAAKRRRVYRKRKALRRVRAVNLHKFIRSRLAYFNVIGGSPAYTGMSFSLSDLPNYSEFTALYDQYTITGVKLTFMWSMTEATNTNGGPGAPTMFLCRDYDDANTPASIDELMQRPFTKTRRIDRPFSIFLRPRPSLETFNGALTSAYSVPNKAPWIDVNNPSVPFYGLKYIMNPYGGTVGLIYGTVTIVCKYYLKFKGVR